MTRKSLQVCRIIVYFFRKPISGGDISCTLSIICAAGVSGSRPSSTVRPHQRRGLPGGVHVPGRNVAKTVLVKTGGVYLLAVLPATSHVDLARLGRALGLDPADVELAAADEIERVFHDCEPERSRHSAGCTS